MEDKEEVTRIAGFVKWFDPVKGFGFVVSESGGPDILLHANVLRNYGQGSIADGAGIEIDVQLTTRGSQAVVVHTIEPPKGDLVQPAADLDNEDYVDDSDIAVEPARVKWFDKTKGFGFANVFGSDEDIFVHVEVLRRCGFADLQPGEAVGLKVVDGERGRMASSVRSWDSVLKT